MPLLKNFLSQDNIKLTGLLYNLSNNNEEIAIYLHGSFTSCFYSNLKVESLAKYLNRKNISLFAFDNRGSTTIRGLKRQIEDGEERVKGGSAYELIEDCIYDIEGALNFLKEIGYTKFHLIGHSTGANKIAAYNYLNDKNEFQSFSLLGLGDDTGLFLKMLGKELFNKILNNPEKYKNNYELVKNENIPFEISLRSVYNIINPNGLYNTAPFIEIYNELNLSKKPHFNELKFIDKPTMMLYGDNDEFCIPNVYDCVEIIKNNLDKDNFVYEIIKEADHSFTEKEDEMAKVVADFISNI